MRCFVHNVLRFVVVLSGGFMCLGPLYADGFSTTTKRSSRNARPAEDEQLKLVATLLRMRMAPLELREGMPLNKVLDHLEEQWAESGKKLKIERAASLDEFCEPLADKKVKYDCKIPAGTCAEVLKSLCHEAGCTYCVKDGAIHVFPYDSETVEEVAIYPNRMIDAYFDRSFSKDKKLKIRSQVAKKFPLGRVKIVAGEGDEFKIRISGSKYACSRAKVTLADMYADWVKNHHWEYYKKEVARQPRFISDAQMNEIFLVPVVFDSSCNLETLLKYFELHARAGGKSRGLRIGTELQNPASVNFTDELDFSCSTLRDALIKVCDACGGHYLVKGRKVTIVPRELETRYYWVTEYVAEKLTRNAKQTAKEDQKEGIERKKKNQRKAAPISDDTWKDLITGQLAEYGVTLPDLGGVEYNSKNRRLKVETSQQVFSELDRLYNVLTPVVQR